MFFPIVTVCLHCRPQTHLVLAFAGFTLTATLFYSSFAQNWQGVYNAFIAAPLSYVYRATGNAASEGAAYHVHPWWQYLKWLFGGNAAFALYSAIGISLGLYTLNKDRNQNTIPIPLKAALAAILGSALSLTAIYSGIPYKTPWCALQMHIPLLIAAFLGLLAFSRCGTAGRIVFLALSAILLCENIHLTTKMWRDPDSKGIPYNYASASPQVKEMAKLIESIASTNTPTHKPANFIAIALPSEDTWPLPFYLRNLNANVGYWTQFEELEVLAALKRRPDMVIVPAEEGHKVQSLFPHLKNTKRFEMRRRVRMRVFW
jgi:predicted membrane-bound mannosyltransferase